jgi:hypothetical protein
MGATFPLLSSKSNTAFILTCSFVSHGEFNLHVGMETYNLLIDVIMGCRLVMTTLSLLVVQTGLFVHVIPFLIWSMIRTGIIDTPATIWRIVPAPDDGLMSVEQSVE